MSNGHPNSDDCPLDPVLESDDVLRRLIDYDEALAAGVTDSVVVDETFQNLGAAERKSVADIQEFLEFLHAARSSDDSLRRAQLAEELTERRNRSSLLTELREETGGSAPGIADASSGLRGRTIGRFHVVSELGRGGHGIVFLARDPALKRNVALKVPRPEMLVSPGARRRFIAEGRATASLDHPHVLKVLEAGETETICYIASEYCSGPTVERWLAEHEPMEPRIAARFVADLADAVEHAHANRILHRDLKPANILLAGVSPLVPKLADFGIAKVFDDEDEATRTMTGTMIGTPCYMSPEQAAGKASQVGVQADVYGLGVVLYEVLTGHKAFDGDSRAVVIQQIIMEEPIRPRSRRPQIPRDLEAICLKCLEKEAARRYQTAAELRDDLQRFLKGLPVSAHPVTLASRLARWSRRKPAAAALAVLTAASLVGFASGGWWHSLSLQREVELVRQERERANAGEAEAQRQRVEAEQQRAAVEVREKQLRRDLFSLDAHSAYGAAIGGRVDRAVEILQSHSDDPSLPSTFVWRYLWRLCHQSQHVWSEPGKECNSVAFSPDGKRLAAGFEYGLAPVWDLVTGKEILRLQGHTNCVNSVRYTPDGKRLLTASCDGTVRIWDAENGRGIRVLQQQKEPVLSLAISVDGLMAASGDGTGKVTLFQLPKGRTLASLPIGRGKVDALAFSADGRWLGVAAAYEVHVCRTSPPLARWTTASAVAQDHTVNAVGFDPSSSMVVWERSKGTADLSNFEHSTRTDRALLCRGNLNTVVFNRDGRRLLCGGESQVMEIWDLERSRRVAEFYGHTNRITDAAFSPDERLIASAGREGTVRLWSMEKSVESVFVPSASGADKMEFAGNGSLLVVGGGGNVRTLDTSRWREKFCFDADHFAISPGRSAELLATARDQEVTVRKMETDQIVRSVKVPNDRARDLALSANGRQLLVSNGWRVYQWDLQSVAPPRVLCQEVGSFISVATSPSEPRFVASNDRTPFKLSDGELDGELRRPVIRGSTGVVREVCFNADGSLFAGASADRSVYVWQAATNELVASLTGHEEPVNCVAFAPDGVTLASGDDSGIVRLWDLTSRREALRLKAHSLPVKSLAFSPDGRLLATATAYASDRGGEVRIWFADPPAR